MTYRETPSKDNYLVFYLKILKSSFDIRFDSKILIIGENFFIKDGTMTMDHL